MWEEAQGAVLTKRFGIDFHSTSCEELACSEVRAAREAECRAHFNGGLGEVFCIALGADPFENNTDGGPVSTICRYFKKQCVREQARRSISTVFPREGPKCVQRIFERCYAQTEPLTEIQPKTLIKKPESATPETETMAPSSRSFHRQSSSDR